MRPICARNPRHACGNTAEVYREGWPRRPMRRLPPPVHNDSRSPFTRVLALRQLASCRPPRVGCRDARAVLGRCLLRMAWRAHCLAPVGVDLLTTDTDVRGRRDVIDFGRDTEATRQTELTSVAITFHHGESHVSRCRPSAPTTHVIHPPASSWWTTTRLRGERKQNPHAHCLGGSSALDLAAARAPTVSFLGSHAPCRPGSGCLSAHVYLRGVGGLPAAFAAAFFVVRREVGDGSVVAGPFGFGGVAELMKFSASNRARSSGATSTCSPCSACRQTPSASRYDTRGSST